MQDEQDQGWSFSDEAVCANCIADTSLSQAVVDSAEDTEVCDFCGGAPAASFDVLMEAFVRGLRHEHEEAIDEVYYDSAEGGYQFLGDHWDSWDLVDEYGGAFANDDVIEAVKSHLNDTTWVEKDFAWRRRDEVLRDAWAQFCSAVKFKTRFVIWLSDRSSDEELLRAGEVPAARILDEIGELIDVLGITRSVEPDELWWRAQAHRERRVASTAARLGTSPIERATVSNRMNPAGIPMFYGAADQDTALAEVIAHAVEKKQRVTIGAFTMRSDVKVVDFTRLRDVPSIFHPTLGAYHRQIHFLHQFVDELSKPISAADEHVEYIPTQILTEYLLKVYGARGAKAEATGMLYRSSQTGRAAAVFNIDNAHCVDSVPLADGPWAVIEQGTVTRLSRRAVRRRRTRSL
ncbi:HEPN-associated N-terminal domain-containing protein [Diaminobutyricibacter sp. McL0608]|uniref:HEPN-associated N-terminal domain-containing protein n=1 Tax=Leifsonia sp. McL0608 TaxID=3143537 RepID=UPI0031F319CE